MKCFKCGNKLEIEYKNMEADYPLVCHTCDENMFIFESIEEYEGECLDMYHYIPLIKNGLLK